MKNATLLVRSADPRLTPAAPLIFQGDPLAKFKVRLFMEFILLSATFFWHFKSRAYFIVTSMLIIPHVQESNTYDFYFSSP